MKAKTTGSHLTETIKRASEAERKTVTDRQAGHEKKRGGKKTLSGFLMALRRAARSRSLRQFSVGPSEKCCSGPLLIISSEGCYGDTEQQPRRVNHLDLIHL